MSRIPHHTPEWQNPSAGDPGRAAAPLPKPSQPSPVPIPYPIVVAKPKGGKGAGDDDDKWIDILSMGPPVVGPHSAQLPGTRTYANLTLKRGMVLDPGERYRRLTVRDVAGRVLVLSGVQVLRQNEGAAKQQEWSIVYEAIQRVN